MCIYIGRFECADDAGVEDEDIDEGPIHIQRGMNGGCELADGAGGAVPAALHANEAEAAVAVGGGGSVSLPVVTVGE